MPGRSVVTKSVRELLTHNDYDPAQKISQIGSVKDFPKAEAGLKSVWPFFAVKSACTLYPSMAPLALPVHVLVFQPALYAHQGGPGVAKAEILAK